MKRIFSTFKDKWPEYLLEILVLIIGIYGAFELENWNENRQRKAEEKVIVESLLSDFKANQMLIQEGIRDHEDNLLYCVAVGRLLGQDPTPANKKLIDSLIYYSAEYTSLELISSTIESVASGDQLSLIQNEKLKKELVEYPRYLGLYKEREMLVRSIVVDMIRPNLEKYVSMAMWLDEVDDLFETNYDGLFRDMEISNNYINRWYQIKGCLARLRSLEKANAEIITILEKELNNRFN
jgi:hypothetical protein